jgi:hypothetical protein
LKRISLPSATPVPAAAQHISHLAVQLLTEALPLVCSISLQDQETVADWKSSNMENRAY